MNKIQRVSLFLRVVFQIAFVIFPVSLAAYAICVQYITIESLSNSGWFAVTSFLPRNIEILHPITLIDSVWIFFLGSMPTGIAMLILYFLIKLFRFYEQGKIFTFFNAKYLRNIGVVMLVGKVVNIIYQLLLTYYNSDHKFMSISYDTYDIYGVIVAIMVIVISWIMVEGCKLQEEQKYIV